MYRRQHCQNNGSLLDASIHHDQTDNINIDRVCLQLEPAAFPTGTFLEDKTFDCIQVGDHLLAMMGDWESRDKVGQASCAPGAIKEKHHVSSHAENNY